MRIDFSGERLLTVIAHPDDAEILCAGTLARALEDGARIGVCLLCRGDKGQPDPPIEHLGEVRRDEMAAAAQLLGAQVFETGYGDGELFDSPESRRRLIDLYRQFRPTLILAHSPQDYHPDHRAASALAEAASWFCASAGHVTERPPMPSPPELWWMDHVNMSDFEPHFFVDVSPYVELKQKMLGCHRSQLQRGDRSDFSPLEPLMLQQCTTRGTQSGVTAAEAFQTHHAWKRTRAW
ncbi:MAG: PIG-L deacetylase family protein [Pirellulaceae bacterium]